MALQRQRALTLIELLLVVGIIAVLAAVALPSFLEANARAKASAAKAGIRELLSGLDAYRVDNNRFPATIASFDGDPFGILADQQLRALTTPVAYVAPATFHDPFGRRLAQISSPLQRRDSDPIEPNDFPFPSIPNAGKSLLYYHFPSFSEMTANPAISIDAVSVVSVGPDGQDSFGAFRIFPPEALPPLAAKAGFQHPVDTIYDPTNGTVSRGDLAGVTGMVSGAARIP